MVSDQLHVKQWFSRDPLKTNGISPDPGKKVMNFEDYSILS
jgi:hypothetical protein